jgi:LPS-assembly protein
VQRLPQFDAFLHKGRIIPSLPLEIEASAQAAYLYRRSGTRGARYEIVPRLTLPVNTRYGSVIASAGIYQTIYETELPSRTSKDANTAPRQNKDTRSVPEFSLASFTEFARVFSLDAPPLQADLATVGESRRTALRHSVQPRLEFRHRLNENQDRNPRYSAEDRLAPQTELVYSLTNVLTTKKERVVLAKNEEGEMVPEIQTSYEDLVRLRLEHAYDFREAARNNDRDEYPRRPYGDIFADLTFFAWENISLETRNDWSPYLGELTRHQGAVTLNFPEYGKIRAGYDLRKSLDEYTRKREHSVNYLTLGLETASFGPWSLYSTFGYDYKDYGNKEMQIDLAYTHQCFKLVGRVSVEPQEEHYQLLIMLTGLGD